MSSKRAEAAVIIHTNAVVSSSLAFLTSQAVPVNVGLTTVSIGFLTFSLIKLLRPEIEDVERVAAGITGTIAGAVATGFVAKSIVGIIPVIGNFTSAAVNFGMIETLGWGLFTLLSERPTVEGITAAEFKEYMKKGEKQKVDVQEVIVSLPVEVKSKYDALMAQMKDKGLSNEDKARIQSEIATLIAPYMPEEL
ncbi:MAG: hypothetical protein U0694_28850 [Anaerolineae bacterium]